MSYWPQILKSQLFHMATTLERLDARAAHTLLCVGLDPRAKSAEEAERICARIIKATTPFAAAYKANAAFFEAHGAAGWAALERVRRLVPSEIPFILDAKRGDIFETAEAYAAAAFDARAGLRADAITLAPYMGRDSVRPFVTGAHGDKVGFVLCRTSNPTAPQFQELDVVATNGARTGEAEPLYARVASAVNLWGPNVGLVVGATAKPQILAAVRRLAPAAWILSPGVGAQGGDLEATVRAACRRTQGRCDGVLITVSRAIADAVDPAAAAQMWRDRIEAVRAAERRVPDVAVAAPVASPSAASLRDRVTQALVDAGCLRFGTFRLKSGATSPVYVDLRRLISFPKAMRVVAEAYAECLAAMPTYDVIAGLPYAALPLATAAGLETGRAVIYPRREAKEYGTSVPIEGAFKKGDRVVVLDDLISSGLTKVEAMDRLNGAGLNVVGIVVLVDRQPAASNFFADRNVAFRAFITLKELVQRCGALGVVTPAQAATVMNFLNGAPSPKPPASKL
jgi:uridine monophosphate synthetase